MVAQPLSVFNGDLQRIFNVVMQEGIQSATQGFSCMVGQHLVATKPRLRSVAFAELPTLFEKIENSAVGVYLHTQGVLSGQMILVFDYARALEIVDSLTSVLPGETQTLGKFECSALAELGNLTSTLFLNVLARHTGLEIRPTPPVVVVDKLAAILDRVTTAYHPKSQYGLVLQTDFLRDDRAVETNFCVIPDMSVLEKLMVHLAAQPVAIADFARI